MLPLIITILFLTPYLKMNAIIIWAGEEPISDYKGLSLAIMWGFIHLSRESITEFRQDLRIFSIDQQF